MIGAVPLLPASLFGLPTWASNLILIGVILAVVIVALAVIRWLVPFVLVVGALGAGAGEGVADAGPRGERRVRVAQQSDPVAARALLTGGQVSATDERALDDAGVPRDDRVGALVVRRDYVSDDGVTGEYKTAHNVEFNLGVSWFL